jgi:hypothetical protein
MTLAPEFSRALHVTGVVTGGTSIFWFYLGLTIGDLASGVLSQAMRSRKRVVFLFLTACAVLVALYFLQGGSTPTIFYSIALLLGMTSGYWALFVTIGAEQFGTNLRATVATTVPNFVRGALVGIAAGFQALRGPLSQSLGPEKGLLYSAAIVGACCLGISLFALRGLQETFDKDLDYVET